MGSTNELLHCQEYLSFRSSIPLRRIVVDSDTSKVFKHVDYITRAIVSHGHPFLGLENLRLGSKMHQNTLNLSSSGQWHRRRLFQAGASASCQGHTSHCCELLTQEPRSTFIHEHWHFLQAEQPAYWTVKEWCEGFKKLLDHLGLSKVHIFGASLGMSC